MSLFMLKMRGLPVLRLAFSVLGDGRNWLGR